MSSGAYERKLAERRTAYSRADMIPALSGQRIAELRAEGMTLVDIGRRYCRNPNTIRILLRAWQREQAAAPVGGRTP